MRFILFSKHIATRNDDDYMIKSWSENEEKNKRRCTAIAMAKRQQEYKIYAVRMSVQKHRTQSVIYILTISRNVYYWWKKNKTKQTKSRSVSVIFVYTK